MPGAMMDTEQLEAWSRSRPHLVLFNRAMTPKPTLADVPAEILGRLNGAQPGFLATSREGLDESGIVLAHDQLAQFQKGEPVLVVVDRVDQLEALKRGRREKKDLERRIQDATPCRPMQAWSGYANGDRPLIQNRSRPRRGARK